MHEIVELGSSDALMTLPTGCLALLREGGERRLWSARIDPGVVEARSTVGSGDAFLAGLVAARYSQRDAEQCLRFAVACGAESVQHFGAGVLDPREVDRLRAEVTVERLPEAALQAGS
jgi:fructose-1-phosphate kinase PfkB-like protein